MFVVKGNGYGHGSLAAATAGLKAQTSGLAVASLQEGIYLREGGIDLPILVFGEPTIGDLAQYVSANLTYCVNSFEVLTQTSKIAARLGRRITVELEFDTGLSRYGIGWKRPGELLDQLAKVDGVRLSGVFSHFAMSDEKDKSFAYLQIERFRKCLLAVEERGLCPERIHMCNSGGFLDLPEAHFNMVRMGILPWGIYPSAVCQRIPGLSPVMTVKSRIVACRRLEPGDSVGYGMHFHANQPIRVATVPIGYGDGYPRIRNKGFVLVRGRRAPVIGGVSMDAMVVNITDVGCVTDGEEVVVMGQQGKEEINVQEIAELKGTVSYEVLTAWRSRLPRVYI
jgi:alanine racemase